MVTGLHEESHGIIENTMFDPILNKTFKHENEADHNIEWFGQNKLAQPIWIANEKGGPKRRSAAEWLGANIAFGNSSPIFIPYNQSTPYEDYIDTFVQLFSNNTINFGCKLSLPVLSDL